MLIGLTGADGVGTVTAADHLCLRHRFTQLPLAELRASWMLADDALDPATENAPSAWIGTLDQHLGDLADVDVVVTAVRFENEAAMIRECGGVIVHVERPGTPRGAGIRMHNSDRVLHNYGTFFHLYDQLDTLVNRLQFERAGA
ncbi:hypothetical protein RSP795_07240 [Ralstonia solanacearum]|uniref:hypothetical protein n=1 Tax=Ralstonia solanacearum TaxID=305 RepID=UPI0007D76886|nr:hypothetical protein [Ralstonia solanacearum]OAI63552.1 hypothetical protein RSP795_07240 [Ralstonia solanacearum]